MKTRGERARAMRLLAGLTGKEAAKYLNTNESYLLRMERGEVGMRDRWVDRLARVYNCRPSDIDPQFVDPDEKKVLATYRSLTTKLKPHADLLLRQLKGEPPPKLTPGATDEGTVEHILLAISHMVHELTKKVKDENGDGDPPKP